MKSLFYKFFKNIAACYRGMNLFWQIFMCALTYALVMSGFDWQYFELTHVAGLQPFLFSAAIVGFFAPLIIPVILLAVGYFKKNARIRSAGFAGGQAAIIGLAMSSFYKVFTGRIGPLARIPGMSSSALSRYFRFGFYRGGAFQGWPSSHTATAFAMSFAIVSLFPENTLQHKLMRYGAVIYAFYIGIGVSTNIHWFSDFAAGAILGAVIGLSVGKAFLERLKTITSI